jgi:hypothetical protein
MTVTAGGIGRLGVVLDQAGMVSFARGNSRVAELIVETAAQHLFVGVPTVALLTAHATVRGEEAARARLGLLTALPAVRVLPLTEVEAAGVANLPAAGDLDGDLGRAHAAWAAETHRAYYATTDARSAPGRLPPGQIVDLAAGPA